MEKNITELLSVIVKAMSDEGVEVTKVEIYEEELEINNKVNVCISHDSYITRRENEADGRSHWSDDDMLIRVLKLLTENDWLPGDDIEAYGEWFTLVVEESSYYTPGTSEKHTNIHYRLLDDNYSLSERMTLEDLKNNYTNVNLEQGRLK